MTMTAIINWLVEQFINWLEMMALEDAVQWLRARYRHQAKPAMINPFYSA